MKLEYNNADLKKCAFCGMEIPVESGRCPYCGSLLDVKVVNDEETVEYTAEPKAKPEAAAAAGEEPEAEPVHVPEPYQNIESGHRQDNRTPSYRSSPKAPLSNGFKVFLTILFTVIPGFGQLAGIITGIIFMNSDDDADRKSFGVAILVASVIMFVLSCIGCFILMLSFSLNQSFEFYGR